MSKELDELLWWIPFKNVRIKIRNIYNNMNNKIEDLNDRINDLQFKNSILEEDKKIKDRFFRYTLYNSDIPHKQKRWFIENIVSKWLGYFINLDNPKTFNEKINWTKLYYRNPEMIIAADKYLFKEYIKNKLGDGYTVPLLGVWDNVNDIDFDSLPNQFVLKSNTGANSDEMIIVKDKSKLNIEEAKIKMNDWLQPWNNIAYKVTYHWDSVDIPQKIIAEEIEKEETEYLFFCSFGQILCISIVYDRTYHKSKKCVYMDKNLNVLNLTRENIDMIENFSKPDEYSIKQMCNISEKLSKYFPIVRIDFYNLKDKLLIGELTFYPSGGHEKLSPIEWDYKFGEMIDLKKIPKEHLSKEWINIIEKENYKNV